MKKETAVEWLVEQLFIASGIKVTKENNPPLFELIEQSKAMEKEQHFELYKLGNSFLDSDNLNFKDYFDQYYNETYEK